MVICTTWMYTVYYVSCSQTASNLAYCLYRLHVTPSMILHIFCWLYVAINVSQKSAKVLLTELSNRTQVSPHTSSLLSAAGASQTSTENNLHVCTAHGVSLVIGWS